MLYSGSESIRWPNKKISTKSCPFYWHFEVQIQVEHGPSNMPVANGSTLYQINITNTDILWSFRISELSWIIVLPRALFLYLEEYRCILKCTEIWLYPLLMMMSTVVREHSVLTVFGTDSLQHFLWAFSASFCH